MGTDAADIDALALSLVREAGRLTRTVFAHTDIGITRSEAGCLARLENGPQRIGDMADSEGLAQPTVSNIAKGLEQAGLVRREVDIRDFRSLFVVITPAGERALNDVRYRYQQFLAEKLRALSADHLDALAGWSQPVQRLLEMMSDTPRVPRSRPAKPG